MSQRGEGALDQALRSGGEYCLAMGMLDRCVKAKSLGLNHARFDCIVAISKDGKVRNQLGFEKPRA